MNSTSVMPMKARKSRTYAVCVSRGVPGRSAILYLMHADPDYPGRDAARLGAIIATRVAGRCAQDRRKRAPR